MSVWPQYTLKLEERRNDDGTLDEVVLYVNGECVFHLEQNSERSWYLGIYAPGQPDLDQQYSINSKRRVRIRNYTDPVA